jgi:hypothetical protein
VTVGSSISATGMADGVSDSSGTNSLTRPATVSYGKAVS